MAPLPLMRIILNRILDTMNTLNTAPAQALHAADLNRATAQAAQVGIDAQVDTNCYRPYDSQLGEQPALAGYRNVKCLYKTNKQTGIAAGDNSQVRIEDGITEEVVIERITELAPYLIGFLQGEQDKIVKKLHLAGMTLLSPTQYSLDEVIAALEASGVSQRLNKEQIEAWFSTEMYEPLLVAFADKMGVSEHPTEEQQAKLDTVIAVYKAKFGSLASGKTHYRTEEADMLLRAIEVTGVEATSMGKRFVARLLKMKQTTGNDLLLAL